MFLAVVSVLIGAPALFYITTGLIATIGACHLQSYLSVRGLRLERVAPETVRVGDLVTVELTVWSDRKIRRPLVTIEDNLPSKLRMVSRTPSLPIAPAYDLPIRSQYQFRPTRRGRHRWSGATVEGTDALGLITKRRFYETAPAEILVLPAPIPVGVELPSAAGWGISEAESGQNRGAGIDPWGIRPYVPGDALRQVHWRSTAKTGQLLVREFEAGSHASAAFLIQRTKGSDLGQGVMSSLDLMCGHIAFLSDLFLRQGARIRLLGLDSGQSYGSNTERLAEIQLALVDVQADQSKKLSEDALEHVSALPPGSVVFIMQSVTDESLYASVSMLATRGTQVVALLYDAQAFSTKKDGKIASATDPINVELLRSAGANPIVMPVSEAYG